MKDPLTGAYEGELVWDGTITPPVWDCVQWNSVSSIVTASPDTQAPNWFRWENPEKSIEMGELGAADHELYLGVDSVSEYGGIYRTINDPWPAFLLEQRLSDPGSPGPGCPPLSELDSLPFSVAAHLEMAEIIKEAGYDPSLHAAQYSIYFIVQNLNPVSPGYGQLLWLGVPIYDDRYPMTPLYVALDAGTGSMIYRIAQEDVASASLHDGGWVSCEVDLLPHAIAALQAVWDLGALTESTDLADYKIGGMNLGWEVPGLARVAISIRNLSLVANPQSTSAAGPSSTQFPKTWLLQNYPNPFNPSTRLPVLLEKEGRVRLSIFNVRGEEIRLLHDGHLDAGRHVFAWDGRDHDQVPVVSGLYFAKVETDGLAGKSRKLVLLR